MHCGGGIIDLNSRNVPAHHVFREVGGMLLCSLRVECWVMGLGIEGLVRCSYAHHCTYNNEDLLLQLEGIFQYEVDASQ
jgi:hypothetical protein